MAKLIPPPVMGSQRATYAHLIKPTPTAAKRSIVAKTQPFDAIANGTNAVRDAVCYDKK